MPAMALDEAARERQAEPEPSLRPGHRVCGLCERLQTARECIRRDSRALVANAGDGLAILAGRLHDNPCAGRRMRDGVGEKLLQRPAEMAQVAGDLEGLVCGPQLDRDLPP